VRYDSGRAAVDTIVKKPWLRYFISFASTRNCTVRTRTRTQGGGQAMCSFAHVFICSFAHVFMAQPPRNTPPPPRAATRLISRGAPHSPTRQSVPRFPSQSIELWRKPGRATVHPLLPLCANRNRVITTPSLRRTPCDRLPIVHGPKPEL